MIEQLTGQPYRGNVAHALWTQIWVQLDEIRDLLHLQSKYLEFFLTKELGFSTEEIKEFLATTQPS